MELSAQIIGIDYPRSCNEDADKFRDFNWILNPKLLVKAQKKTKKLNYLQKVQRNINCQAKTASEAQQIIDKVFKIELFDTNQQLCAS